MRGAGLALTCRTAEEWERTLERLMDDEPARREAGERGRSHAEEAYGEVGLLARWDGVMRSVLRADVVSAPPPSFV
jgi:hypothetical protein